MAQLAARRVPRRPRGGAPQQSAPYEARGVQEHGGQCVRPARRVSRDRYRQTGNSERWRRGCCPDSPRSSPACGVRAHKHSGQDAGKGPSPRSGRDLYAAALFATLGGDARTNFRVVSEERDSKDPLRVPAPSWSGSRRLWQPVPGSTRQRPADHARRRRWGLRSPRSARAHHAVRSPHWPGTNRPHSRTGRRSR